MTWLHYQFQGLVAMVVSGSIGLLIFWFVRRPKLSKPEKGSDNSYYYISAFVGVVFPALALAAFWFFDGSFYFEDLDPPTCTSVTIDGVDTKTYPRHYDVDQFVVDATPSAIAEAKKNSNVFGLHFTPRTSWRVDVEDTDIDARYRGPAVLTQRYGHQSRKTHFGLAMQCPAGAKWDAK
jgi:hypothetical protein